MTLDGVPVVRRLAVVVGSVALMAVPLMVGGAALVQARVDQAEVLALRQELDAARLAGLNAGTVQQSEPEVTGAPTTDDDAGGAGGGGAETPELTQRYQDLAAVEELIEIVFTWDDHDSYEAGRAALVERYGAAPDSSLLTTAIPADPVSRDAEGKEYSYLEAAGLNLHPVDSRPWLVSDSGGVRHYAALVDVASTVAGRTSEARTVWIEVAVRGRGASPSLDGVVLRFSLIN